MHTNHPNIMVDFAPGGCTGVHQPCDVGIQWPLKLSMRKSYHETIVNELLTEFEIVMCWLRLGLKALALAWL